MYSVFLLHCWANASSLYVWVDRPSKSFMVSLIHSTELFLVIYLLKDFSAGEAIDYRYSMKIKSYGFLIEQNKPRMKLVLAVMYLSYNCS